MSDKGCLGTAVWGQLNVIKIQGHANAAHDRSVDDTWHRPGNSAADAFAKLGRRLFEAPAEVVHQHAAENSLKTLSMG